MPQISPPKPKNKKKAPPPKERKVEYPEIVTAVCQGDTALTVEKAKELLGWEEETDDVKFGDDYTLLDFSDPPKKVRLTKCSHNRPYDRGLAARYVQEHLNKRWQINGESRIIGKYAEVISGQHSMSALVLADQARRANPHWEANWPCSVTMATVIVFGVEETDDVVNTNDTGKPRSLSDVLYRSEHFSDYKPKDRKTAARIGDYAIRMLWHRTGADADAFAPKRTHAESLAFLDGHRTLAKRVVRHVMEEDKSGGVSAVMSPGYTSALAYLMAQSKTDPAKYREHARDGVRSEKHLDLSMLDKAEEFVLLLGQEGSEVGKAVRKKLEELNAREIPKTKEKIPATLAEKIAIIILVWKAFAEGKPIRLPDESKLLVDVPLLGGIDKGEEPDEDDDADVEEEEEEDDEEAPSEKLRKDLEATRPDRVKALVEQRKKEAKAKKEAMRDAKAAPPSNGQALSVADEIRQQYAPVAEAHPGKIVFWFSKTSGGLTCIDADAVKVSRVLDTPATKDPSGFVRFSISKADTSKKLSQLMAEGLGIVIAEDVLSGNGFKKEKTVKVSDYTGK